MKTASPLGRGLQRGALCGVWGKHARPQALFICRKRAIAHEWNMNDRVRPSIINYLLTIKIVTLT